MSATKKMTLRVQWAEGTERVEAIASEGADDLAARVRERLQLSEPFTLCRDRARRDALPATDASLTALGLRHGDMLYLDPPAPTRAAPAEPGPSAAPHAATAPSAAAAPRVDEDEVDLELYQMSGNIHRQRDEKLCRHNSKGSCVHCAPLEPWDEAYLREHGIKHLSFHAYLRKITSGKFVSLEELSCKIKPGCKDHPPWPRGICSSCQPAAVTLNRQPYRHVDNVLVEHASLVERFLSYWRATGHQRLGYLYGRYERHPDVPLGVRARVCAVYEPPQRATRDHLTLQPDPLDEAVERVARGLQLRRVGWIFTDLLADDVAKGTVQQTRGVDTHFLSAQECLTAAHLQNQHPNACRHAPSGHFGSKFVTVCATGDSSQQVHLEGYQVSGQCAALARDGVLVPTRDAPELGYIRDSSDAQFVPDVYYKERDEYGNEVGVSARTVPTAYLLVDVPVGVAGDARPVLSARAAFPPAHRALPRHEQSLRALHEYLFAAEDFLAAASDLHVLVYLASNSALPLDEEALEPLLRAVRERDWRGAERWRQSPAAATLEQLARAAAAQGAPDAAAWTCPLCTYHNAPRHDACEMCAMPRNSGM